MPEQQFHDSVVAADRWSKVAALVVAIAVFLLVREPVGDVQFASIVAAMTGIGTRLYIPFHASVRVPEADRVPISNHPTAGSYNHGAAGLGLIVASMAALGTFLVGHGFLAGVGVGGISGVVGYAVFVNILPSE
ncbi:hypothetical protein C461_04117 [Halorubrum aidingense JCM 13560]|uniref:Uncharacterized protein n=1 Tax=Halorubrum aidingense JCM 13560 TaxID=1230454 RepID=M0PGR9_9EURY|nr:hypothetical protein [Halorubrum aidingense]EMA68784.1 hypothetical protein C461_04117 [Halorubrum aidingense JCM 13560]